MVDAMLAEIRTGALLVLRKAKTNDLIDKVHLQESQGPGPGSDHHACEELHPKNPYVTAFEDTIGPSEVLYPVLLYEETNCYHSPECAACVRGYSAHRVVNL